jgi:hypothetical protein
LAILNSEIFANASQAMRHCTFSISTAESALAGIAALVPVRSAPEPPYKTPGPQGDNEYCQSLTILASRNRFKTWKLWLD